MPLKEKQRHLIFPLRPAALAVIIPSLNEVERLPEALAKLKKALALADLGAATVVVVEGGNSKETLALARQAGALAARCPPGRARQMGLGASLAGEAEVLVFVHADTALPEDYFIQLRVALEAGAMWGYARIRLDDTAWWARSVSALMNLRSRLSGIGTGDQALYARRSLYYAVGGMPPVALMEDIRLCARLKALAPPTILPGPVVTSARRWRRRGVVRTIALMWVLRLLHFLGADPRQLARWYR